MEILKDKVELWTVISFVTGAIIAICIIVLIPWIVHNADVIDKVGEDVVRYLFRG